MSARLILGPWAALDPATHAGSRRVVTPNPRAAARLDAPGLTLERLARQVLRTAGLDVAPALLATRLLEDAAPEAITGPDPRGVAQSLSGALKQLFRAGADLDAIADQGSERASRLARLGIAYRAKLRARGLVDAAEALMTASTRVTARQPLLVFGYARLGRDEAAFLAAIADDQSVLLLPDDGSPIYADQLSVATALEAAGWHVSHVSAPEAPAVPTLAHRHATMAAEVRGALGAIKQLLHAGVAPADITLVARDDAFYGPTVLALAWEYGVPVRALYQTPLAETLVGSWVAALIDVVEGEAAYEPTLRFLGHPYGPPLPATWWDEARKTRPASFSAWASQLDLSALRWPAMATRSAWAQLLSGLVGTFELRQKASDRPRELLAVAELREGLAVLAEPGDETLVRERFIRELRDALAQLGVPAQPGRGGVELHTPLSLYGTSYRHVFTLGVAEGHLPARLRDDPAFDYAERAALAPLGCRLEGPAEAARREALSFDALLAVAGESLTLTYPALIGKDEALPSAYLKRYSLTPAPVLSAMSPEEARRPWVGSDEAIDDGLLPHARAALSVERRREGADPHDEFDGVVKVSISHADRVFSATQITTLAQCPFRWLAAYAMRLAEPDEADEGLTPSLRGTLYHKALELAVEGWTLGTPLRDFALDRLEAAFAQAEIDLAVTRLPAWGARRAEHLSILRRAVAADDFARDDATLVGTELHFETQWQGLAVQGYIDRVDRTPDGLVLVDYKTSASVPSGGKDDNNQAKLDIQLPIYVQAAAPALFPGEPVAEATYYSLTKGKTLKRAEVDEPAMAALGDRLKAHLADGHFPVSPDVNEKACEYCDHALMCRRGPRLARKGAQA
jgi:RecB family exonuclease